MKNDDEQIKWQRSVIRDEMDELQKQWEKAITEDWRENNERVRSVSRNRNGAYKD